MSFSSLVVGLGQIGMGYDLHLDPTGHILTHARAFSQHPGFRLLAGVDPVAGQRQIFEQAYQRPAYADVSAALRSYQPDIVVIASPTGLHGETLTRVLEQARPRVVLCEKPLSYDLGEARTMVQACSAMNVDLYVNYMRRSDLGVIEVKRRLESGEIGTPVKGVAWYSKGFQHNGSHFFNLLEYWLGSMAKSEVLDRGRLWEDIDPEMDVRVTFADGTIVFLASREDAFSHYAVELLATNGRLAYEQGGRRILWQAVCPDPFLQRHTALTDQAENIDHGMDRYQWHVADELARALDGLDAHLCSGEDALRTLSAMKQILEQA